MLATGFVPAGAGAVWALAGDLSRWNELFPAWISETRDDDDRFHVVGASGERYDMYPSPSEDGRAIDVEVVDELGNADVVRVRLIEARGGGCFVAVVAGRLSGVSDEQWRGVRAAIENGIELLPERLQ